MPPDAGRGFVVLPLTGRLAGVMVRYMAVEIATVRVSGVAPRDRLRTCLRLDDPHVGARSPPPAKVQLTRTNANSYVARLRVVSHCH